MAELFKLNLSSQGKNVEVPFEMEDYRRAADKGLSLTQYVNRKVATDNRDPGTAFEQCMAASGLVQHEDRDYGYRSPTISALLSGEAFLDSGAITRPNGDDRFTPAGRYFFPQVLLEVLESQLRDDRASYTAAFNDMIATTVSVQGPRYDQVVIDYTKPRETRSQPISQLAEPTRLISITTSSVQRALPTWSIGIEISDQAAQAATLGLVQIALREQGSEEAARRLNEDFMGIVNGNADAGEAGIIGAAKSVLAYDSSLTSNGTISQKAWVKFLMDGWMRRRISHVVCNIDTYLAIEGRANRPVKNDEPAVDERLNTIPRMALDLIPANVKVFPMEDFPADLIVGLDSSKALRRVIQVSAAYSAIESYVMRRSSAMRIDKSERVESLGYAEAFSVLTLDGAST